MTSQRRTVLIVIILLLLVALALLLSRCHRSPASAPTLSTPKQADSVSVDAKKTTAADASANPAAPEKLGPATVECAPRVIAGAALSVRWTGPNNPDDYLTIVAPDAAASEYGNYTLTAAGNPLQVVSPVEAGKYQVRYVTGRSKKVLAAAPLEVVKAEATLQAVDEVMLGSTLSVAWTGPDNEGDYIALVPAGYPDNQYGNYTFTAHKSPVSILVPAEAGPAEIRYLTGQNNQVLARRPVKILQPKITLSASAEAVEGSPVKIDWTGPTNPGDYLTIVPAELPDGRYDNYALTGNAAQVTVLAPIQPGPAEIRYMTGQGAKVLGRRAISITAAKVTLEAPSERKPGSDVEIKWTGPNNPGDYITIVAKGSSDSKVEAYRVTSSGPTLTIAAPKESGAAEIRYVSGQKGKILARRALQLR